MSGRRNGRANITRYGSRIFNFSRFAVYKNWQLIRGAERVGFFDEVGTIKTGVVNFRPADQPHKLQTFTDDRAGFR